MRLFLKHIARSVLKSPLQPLLILLTVALAVSAGITASCVRSLFEDHAKEELQKDVALGDVIISVRRDSHVRMLFCEDAEAIVGDRGTVMGEYILTVFAEKDGAMRTVSAAATDLARADRYFQFEYVEYGRFTSSELERSVVISETLSHTWDLHVGDPFRISFLGEEQVYTVEAVAKDSGLLLDRDVLIPISGVVRMLAQRIPTIAALGDSFVPYNRLMIRSEDTGTLSQMFEALSSSSDFADYQVELVRNTSRTDYHQMVQNVAVGVLMLLLLVMCALLIGTSLNLLRLQRDTEYALFCSAGASRHHLEVLQITESVVYSLLGSIGGVMLASPMVRFVGGFFLWQRVPLTLHSLDALMGVLFAMTLMTFCTAQHLWRQKDVPLAVRLSDEMRPTAEVSSSGRMLLIPLCCMAVDGIMLVLLPSALRYIPAILGCLILVWLLYMIIPYFLRGWAKLAERCLEHASRPRAWLLLAVKNVSNHIALRQVARLLSVLLAMLVTIYVIGTTLIDQQHLLNQVITSPLLTVNAPANTAEELRQDPAVKGVATFDLISGAEICEKHTAMVALMSGDVEECFADGFVPSRMPRGNEAVLSKGIATLLNTRVGEEITITMQGVPYTVTVCAVDNIPANLIYMDMDAIGSSRELIAITLTDAALKDTTASERITGELEMQGAVMLEAEWLFGSMPQTLEGFVSLLRWCVIISVMLSLIGCANMMAEQFRSRRHERWLLRLSGMERSTLAWMCVAEFGTIVVSAAVLAILFGGTMCMLLNVGVQSFGLLLF